jgi:hypothetical protein
LTGSTCSNPGETDGALIRAQAPRERASPEVEEKKGDAMPNWILRRWRGDVSLAKAFWGHLFLGSAIVVLPAAILIQFDET